MKNSDKLKRAVAFYLSVLLFFIILPILLSYSLGYRIDYKALKVYKTGIIFINSKPSGASIYINDKLYSNLTPAYQWMTDNAHKYGFVLSYPKDNSYYVYEPWHWRFVGVKLATDLHNQGKNFYDLDQRVIDTYLVNIFD